MINVQIVQNIDKTDLLVFFLMLLKRARAASANMRAPECRMTINSRCLLIQSDFEFVSC